MVQAWPGCSGELGENARYGLQLLSSFRLAFWAVEFPTNGAVLGRRDVVPKRVASGKLADVNGWRPLLFGSLALPARDGTTGRFFGCPDSDPGI